MTEKQTKRRLIITNVLFWFGILVLLCSMGRLDYLNEQRITYGIEELWFALGKGVVGIILMLIGTIMGRNLEFEDESEVDEDVNE
ncbi:MAG: hypothetical protein HDT43_00930 [Ruminococcaceae bacterium]|nr:hypothetical protein [Oscillospiraceae bacterium]